MLPEFPKSHSLRVWKYGKWITNHTRGVGTLCVPYHPLG